MKKDVLYTVTKTNSKALNNALSHKGNIFVDGGSTNWGGIVQAAADAVNSAGSQIANNNTTNNKTEYDGDEWPEYDEGWNGYTFQSGFYDMADPLYYVTGDRHSKVGDALSQAGIGATSSGNVWGALAGGILKSIGDFVNAGWGTKRNEAGISKIKNDTDLLNRNGRALLGASTPEELQNIIWNSNVYDNFSKGYIGEDGWFTDDIQNEYENLTNSRKQSRNMFKGNYDLAVQQMSDKERRNQRAQFVYADGGFLGPMMDFSPSGATDYSLMSDYLLTKQKQAGQKSSVGGNVFAREPQSTLFAIGGDLQTHGADWSNGTIHVDAGSTHELNPNEGVQVGTDAEGTPNLVEEGEIIFNDYVYSNRIKCDATTKERFRFPKKRDITFAEAAKKLEQEISERPNDPISAAGFKAQMQSLAEEQERQKQEMEAKEAERAFNALSDEEKVALMNEQAAREEAAIQQEAEAEQQQALAQEAMQQGEVPVQPMQQVSPDEEALAAAMQQQEMANMQARVAALGGRLVIGEETKADKNLFAKGGRKWNKKYTKDWFKNAALALGIDENAFNGLEFYNDKDESATFEAFNNTLKDIQRTKALEKYKKNKLAKAVKEKFNAGLYKKNDDGRKFRKVKLDSDGNIVKNGKGEIEWDGEWLDYNDAALKTALELDDAALADGFSWNPNSAYTVQPEVKMKRSAQSYLGYAPLINTASKMIINAANKADYSRADAIEKAGDYTPFLVHHGFTPRYLKPSHLDSMRGINALMAQSAGINELMEDDASPIGARRARQLANAYKTQDSIGNLLTQAQMYNDAQDEKRAAYNADQDKTKASLDLQAQMANQNALWNAHQGRYQSILTANQMKDAIDAARYGALSENMDTMASSMSELGKEADYLDTIDYFKRLGIYKGANGGKLKRKKTKRGLTF